MKGRVIRFTTLSLGFLVCVLSACVPDTAGADPTLVKTSSICLDINPKQLADYLVFDFYDKEGEAFLFGYNPVNASLDVFSFAEHRFVKAMPFSQAGPDGIADVIAIKVISPEEVWLATLNDFVVYDFKLGAIRNRISLDDLNDKFSLARYAYFFENHGELVAMNDSTVLIQAGFFPLYDGASSLHLAQMNVKSGRVAELPVRLPAWVNTANHFGALNAIQYGYSTGDIYYSFPFTDSLYRYRPQDKQLLPPLQLDSPRLPTVLSPYRGDGSMTALVDYASSSSFYMGFHKIAGLENGYYRFVVSASEKRPVSFSTKLEVFNRNKLVLRHELCNWCKTRSFVYDEKVYIFMEGTDENKLCFETVDVSTLHPPPSQ